MWNDPFFLYACVKMQIALLSDHDEKKDLFPSYSVCLLRIHVYDDKTIRQSCTINFTVNGRKRVHDCILTIRDNMTN